MRLNINSLLNRKRYPGGTLEWDIRTGRLKVHRKYQVVDNSERPNCASCEFGKVHCRYNKLNKIKNTPMKDQYLKKDNFLPGHMLPTDHYISRDPGRLLLRSVIISPGLLAGEI